jgi:FdhD protein
MSRAFASWPIRCVDERETATTTREDSVAVEAPLALRLGGADLTITMRTPGQDEDLAAGFLFTEGLVATPDELVSFRASKDESTLDIALTGDRALSSRRTFLATAACGVCGRASLDDLRAPAARTLIPERPRVARDVILKLPRVLAQAQPGFRSTGGLHAAALFDTDGRLLRVREDIGRHNAVDKLIGSFWREGQPFHPESLLLLSGRAGFELIQKAIMAQIPIVAAVGAPSSAALEIASQAGMTLIGFLRGQRFNIYTGPERLITPR